MPTYRIMTDFSAYRIGDDGTVWSRWQKGPNASMSATWRKLKTTRDRDGYRRVQLTATDGRKITRKVCVLVLTAFVGARQSCQECRHLNGDCSDDRLDNLAWGTSQENHDDKQRHGTTATGMNHGLAKLTDEEIADILAMKGKKTQQAVADQFGVSRGYVGQLWSGKRKRVTAS